MRTLLRCVHVDGALMSCVHTCMLPIRLLCILPFIPALQIGASPGCFHVWPSLAHAAAAAISISSDSAAAVAGLIVATVTSLALTSSSSIEIPQQQSQTAATPT
jgi:hypothetical protein